MSELLPCPLCSGTNLGWHEGDLWCENLDCLFHCPKNRWQALPRTRWVSAEDRLPEQEGRYFIRYTSGKAQRAKMFAADLDWIYGAFRWSTGLRDITITHWLDGVPDLPEGV